MPQAVDLVLKNAAAADKTFTLYSPSAGDNSLATWKLKEGTIAAVFPSIITKAWSTGNDSRKMDGRLRLPSSYTTAATGLTTVGSGAELNFSVSIPNDYPENLKADFVAFAKNLLANAVIQAQMTDAVPAT